MPLPQCRARGQPAPEPSRGGAGSSPASWHPPHLPPRVPVPQEHNCGQHAAPHRQLALRQRLQQGVPGQVPAPALGAAAGCTRHEHGRCCESVQCPCRCCCCRESPFEAAVDAMHWELCSPARAEQALGLRVGQRLAVCSKGRLAGLKLLPPQHLAAAVHVPAVGS